MISIVIPVHGEGAKFLPDLIDSIQVQTFTDYEVVISDNGQAVFGEAKRAMALLPVVRWTPGWVGAAANLNHAIEFARGDIIKPMFQDDKFMEPDSLQKIADAFDAGAEWIACQSQNGGDPGMRSDRFVPYPHRGIFELRTGENTYGSPSAMAWRKNDLRFDENLHWLFDCEFYARMAERHGVPLFIPVPIFIRQWGGMATLTVATGSQRIADHNYVAEKYR